MWPDRSLMERIQFSQQKGVCVGIVRFNNRKFVRFPSLERGRGGHVSNIVRFSAGGLINELYYFLHRFFQIGERL